MLVHCYRRRSYQVVAPWYIDGIRRFVVIAGLCVGHDVLAGLHPRFDVDGAFGAEGAGHTRFFDHGAIGSIRSSTDVRRRGSRHVRRRRA